MVEKLINGKLVDYIAIDYKGPFTKYSNYTNKTNIQISNLKKTIEILLRSEIAFELRTTVVPTLHTKEDLIQMAKGIENLIIENSLKIVNCKLKIIWYLQQFRPKHCLDSKFEKITPYSDKWFDEVLKELRLYPINVKLRGN